MPSSKALKVTRTKAPIRFQDGTGLPAAIAALLDDRFEALEARVAALEALLASLLADIESGAGRIVVFEKIDLIWNRRGGVVDVTGAFRSADVGTKLFGMSGPTKRLSDSEAGIVFVVGEVVNRKRARLAWFAPGEHPRRVNLNCILGAGVR